MTRKSYATLRHSVPLSESHVPAGLAVPSLSTLSLSPFPVGAQQEEVRTLGSGSLKSNMVTRTRTLPPKDTELGVKSLPLSLSFPVVWFKNTQR